MFWPIVDPDNINPIRDVALSLIIAAIVVTIWRFPPSWPL